MKVLFLAAGQSKRLWPLLDKNFLEFLRKPLIEHQFDALVKAGFREIVVVCGAHNLDAIRNFAFSYQKKLRVDIVQQPDLETGMAGAVLAAESVLKDEPMMIVSGNDVVDDNAYKLLLGATTDSSAESFLIGKRVTEYFPGGYLKITAKHFIEKIIEKPGKGNEPSDMVNLVLHIHKKPSLLFQYLQKSESQRDDLYEVALDHMIRDGIKMMAVPYDGFWKAVKYPWHVMELARHFFAQASAQVSARASSGASQTIDPSAVISPTARIHGDVIIEEGVKIFDGATVRGPVYLGPRSIVATNALVRDSHLGADCVVGFGTEVARSYLGNNVWMHTNYVGDSLVSDNCSFGSGAVLANLRLDEREISLHIQTDIQGENVPCGSNKMGAIIGPNVRVGVNTSIMPGVKIGAGSFIGSGIVVGQDIPEKSFVTGKWDLKIVENKASLSPAAREEMRKKL